MTEQDDLATRVALTFDEIADDYDQSGVAFFGPIAQELVELLAPAPGERVVDIGCGRGAVTFAAAAAVGPAGRVTAVDIAPAMVDLTARGARERGLTQVRTVLATADALGLPEAEADVVAASLVLFFSPDPLRTLTSWVRLLAPGGRIGISTFGDVDPVWASMDDLFRPYLPAQLLDARTSGTAGPFATDEGVEQLLLGAGASQVRSVPLSLRVRFEGAEQWRRFSMGTGQRAFWRFVPEDRRDVVLARATELLETARDNAGEIVLVQDVRYTLGRATSK